MNEVVRELRELLDQQMETIEQYEAAYDDGDEHLCSELNSKVETIQWRIAAWAGKHYKEIDQAFAKLE